LSFFGLAVALRIELSLNGKWLARTRKTRRKKIRLLDVMRVITFWRTDLTFLAYRPSLDHALTKSQEKERQKEER